MIIHTSDVRNDIAHKYKNARFVTDKSGARTVEIIGASFIADEPTIFGVPNDKYIEQELKWYLSQSLYVKDINVIVPKIWIQVASHDGKINSNYGYLIYSEENHNQYNCALEELLRARDSRRAVMIYTRPTIHSEYNVNGMSDFICTNAVQYVIRDGRMHTIVQMRSNDVVFGYRNDYAWQKYVTTNMVRDYNLRITDPSDAIVIGDIIWHVGSLHVYERHFSLIEDYIASMQELS